MSDAVEPAVPVAIRAPRRRSWPYVVLSLLALGAAIAGGLMLRDAGEGTVETIRVTKHSMLPESLVGTPDYFVVVTTRDNKTINTEPYDDTPIGNGLDFKLPEPLALANITHLQLLDEDLRSDDIRDRVDVRGRVCRGQDYQFELLGPPPPERATAYWLLGGGGAGLFIAAILWVRANAV
jgi:hypothetical protein